MKISIAKTTLILAGMFALTACGDGTQSLTCNLDVSGTAICISSTCTGDAEACDIGPLTCELWGESISSRTDGILEVTSEEVSACAGDVAKTVEGGPEDGSAVATMSCYATDDIGAGLCDSVI